MSAFENSSAQDLDTSHQANTPFDRLLMEEHASHDLQKKHDFTPKEKDGLPDIKLTRDLGTTATAMYNALCQDFRSGDNPESVKFTSLYLDTKDLASAWDMGEVLDSTVSMGLNSGQNSKEFELNRAAAEHYWDNQSGPPGYDSGYGPAGDKYYDDNHWFGLALVDAYKQRHEPGYLDRAKQVLNFDKFGAQGTDQLPCPGGVFWTQQAGNEYRATVSTAGAAQLALELYDAGRGQNDRKQQQEYLDFAKKEFDWVDKNLRGPNGLYFDGMDNDGKIHPEQYTYNQGLMLGDAVLLFKATNDVHYLQKAQDIANASLQAFSKQDNAGGPDPFNKQPLFFNAVFFKNLMLLDSVVRHPEYRQALADYAEHVVQQVDPSTNLVKVDGKSTLLDQSSAIQVLELAKPFKVDTYIFLQ